MNHIREGKELSAEPSINEIPYIKDIELLKDIKLTTQCMEMFYACDERLRELENGKQNEV